MAYRGGRARGLLLHEPSSNAGGKMCPGLIGRVWKIEENRSMVRKMLEHIEAIEEHRMMACDEGCLVEQRHSRRFDYR